MGKRSSGFARADHDFYPTPAAAMPPLVPFLARDGIRTFAEPCAGDGHLVAHLQSCGLTCNLANDIARPAGVDALKIPASEYSQCDAIITNPPYDRPLMHSLIRHFQDICPTWLLIEVDWLCTKQARPYLINCTDIVNVGRLRLIEGTAHNGKQNFCWARFHHRELGPPLFHTVALTAKGFYFQKEPVESGSITEFPAPVKARKE